MEGQNILYGGIDDLKQIKGMLEAYVDVKNQVERLGTDKQRLEREITTEEKTMQNNIETVVKKRREQVVSEFDKELKNAQDKMRVARNEKSKEKTKRVNKRIEEETADIVLRNKNLLEEKRTYFKQKGIALFWDNPVTYMLYFPKSLLEIILLITTTLVCLVGLPTLVVCLTNIFWLFDILIFLAIDAVFVIIYMLGYEVMRMRNKDAFIEMRIKRKEIKKNNKEINKIKNRILNDKNEEQYKLGEFDSNISEIEENINDIVARKNAALNEFEKNTKAEITEEITSRDMVKINAIKAELNDKTVRLKEFEQKQKDMNLNLSTNYGTYLGNENLTVKRIDELIVLIEEGKAKNISEALNFGK